MCDSRAQKTDHRWEEGFFSSLGLLKQWARIICGMRRKEDSRKGPWKILREGWHGTEKEKPPNSMKREYENGAMKTRRESFHKSKEVSEENWGD